MVTIIAKNQTGSPLSVFTLSIPDNEIPASPAMLTLTDFAEPYEIYDNAEILGYINSGDLLLNDGSIDLNMTESLDFVTSSNLLSDIENAGLTGLQGITGTQGITGLRGFTGVQGVTGIWGDQSRVLDIYSTIDSGNFATDPVYTDLTFNAQRIIDTSHFSHTSGTAPVIINVTGRYLIVARCNTNQTATNIRTESAIRIVRDQGLGFSLIPGTLSYMYNRNNSEGSTGTSSSLIISLDAGDVIKVQGTMVSGGGTIFARAEGFSLTMQYVDTDILGTTGVQGLTGLASGPQGSTGVMGIPGQTGIRGATGSSVQGQTGIQGTTGIQASLGVLPVVQARRTTGVTGIPLTWTDLDFDTTDIETNDLIIEHDNVLRDRILIKRTGLYRITYLLTCDDEVQGRVRINDTTVISGSTQQAGDPTDVNDVLVALTTPVYANLTSGNFISVQIQAATTAENLQANALFLVELTEGPQGATGLRGLTGIRGLTGAGIQGSTGLRGVTGITNVDLIDDIVSATGTVTTTSVTDILITSMTITPAAGTYMIWFSSSGSPQTNGQSQIVSLYAGGTQISGSERTTSRSFVSTTVTVATHGRATVNGSQAIEARWRVSGGTGQLGQRTLAIIRVT